VEPTRVQQVEVVAALNVASEPSTSKRVQAEALAPSASVMDAVQSISSTNAALTATITAPQTVQEWRCDACNISFPKYFGSFVWFRKSLIVTIVDEKP
jgi:hypothetical protein